MKRASEQTVAQVRERESQLRDAEARRRDVTERREDTLGQQLLAAQTSLTSMTARADDLRSQVDGLSIDGARASAEVSALKTENTELKCQISEAQGKLSAADRQADELQRLRDTEQQLRSQLAPGSNRLDTQNLAATNLEIEKLRDALRVAQADAHTCSAKAMSSETAKSELGAKLVAQKAEISGLATRLEKARARNAQLESECNRQITTLNTSAPNPADDKRLDFSRVKAEMQNVHKKNTELAEELSRVTRQNVKQKQELATSKQNLALALTGKKDALQDAANGRLVVDGLRRDVKRLQDALDAETHAVAQEKDARALSERENFLLVGRLNAATASAEDNVCIATALSHSSMTCAVLIYEFCCFSCRLASLRNFRSWRAHDLPARGQRCLLWTRPYNG